MKKILILSIAVITFAACKKENNDNYLVTDIDGNIYSTVKIGTQVWMTENLKVTKYRNGDLIDNSLSNICGEDSPKYQWAANGEEANVEKFGRLYTWYTTTDSRGLCPSGWHVPNDEEWKTLEMELGMNQSEVDKTGFRGEDEGSQLAGDASLWMDGILKSNPAFAVSGFNALPGGYRYCAGGYYDFGEAAVFWTSEENSSSEAFYRYISFKFTDIFRNFIDKRYGYSIRCVKD